MSLCYVILTGGPMQSIVSDALESKNSMLYTIKVDEIIRRAIRFFNQFKIGALIVVDGDEKIEGIITERDVMKKLSDTDDNIKDLFIKDIMTPRSKLFLGREDDTIESIMGTMTKNRIRHIPIVDDGEKCIGMVSIGDVIKALLERVNEENESLKNYIHGG